MTWIHIHLISYSWIRRERVYISKVSVTNYEDGIRLVWKLQLSIKKTFRVIFFPPFLTNEGKRINTECFYWHLQISDKFYIVRGCFLLWLNCCNLKQSSMAPSRAILWWQLVMNSYLCSQYNYGAQGFKRLHILNVFYARR